MFLLLFTIAVLYLLYSWLTARPTNFPPGPPHVPIFGCVPFMPRENIHFEMENWKKKYGGVVGLLMGNNPVVAVCSAELVREVLKRDEFQGRPINVTLQKRSFDKRIGIMFADGTFWSEQRRFTVRHLKEFGFGKTSMEDIILEEIDELIQEINGQTVQVSGLFNLSSVNVLWAIMAGIRYKRSDPRLQILMKNLTELFRSGNPTGGNLAIMFPFLTYIFPSLVEETNRIHNQTNSFIQEVIREHDKTLDVNMPRDFIDVYLSEMRHHKKEDSSFTEEGLIIICADLFTAGSESVGNTLGFALLYMVLYPEVQRKVQEVIDACIGQERKPSLHDRARLPYVEAVLMEVQRCNSIAPLTVPHRTFQDTTLDGYYIPKNTTVLVSLWSLLHSKEHWGDPEQFRPSRFIDENGKLKKDEQFLIPFGVGKRLCPGEALARNVLFLFFTSLMQKFTIKLPENAPKPSTISLSGFTTAPQPFEVTFVPR